MDEEIIVSTQNESLFGQVATSAPAVAFTTGEGGGIPRDLGNIYGPDGLGVDLGRPELVGGITDLVSGVYRAVSGSPRPAPAPSQPTGMFTSTTLIVGIVLIGVVWLAMKS